jgi:hypothetical protein
VERSETRAVCCSDVTVSVQRVRNQDESVFPTDSSGERSAGRGVCMCCRCRIDACNEAIIAAL